MNAKKIILAVIMTVVAVGLIFAVLPKDSAQEAETPAETPSTQTQPQEDTTEQPAAEPTSFTAAQVAEHDSADDCWTIISGNVYNITSYIPRHPGGNEILRACGKDGTSLFTQRETADGQEVGSGSPHSRSAQSMLEQLKVGTLVD